MKSVPLLARLGACAVAMLLAGSIALASGIDGLAVSATSFPVSPPAQGAPPAAGDLPIPEIGTLAAAAGFKGTALAMAVAIALAESSGNPNATNFDSNGTVDRGVWQINSVHTEFSAACDYDPPCAANAAFSISDGGTDWGPWVTYQHGAEIVYLPEATAYVEAQGTAS
jgi:hypothetical protein